MAILIFLVILLPLGIISRFSDHPPVWNAKQWAIEIEAFRATHYPAISGGADSPIKNTLDCVLNKIKSMFCPYNDRLMREIILRKQYRTFNEVCTSETGPSDYILNPSFGYYERWQDKLIDSGEQFCNPLKHLRCSALKKCVCRDGSTWSTNDPDKNICIYLHGSPCGHDRTKFYYFNLRQTFLERNGPGTGEALPHEIVGPKCSKHECSNLEFIKTQYTCINESLGTPIRNLNRSVENLPKLSLDETCVLEDHTSFFTYTKEEDAKFETRLANVKALVDKKAKFCDPDKLLICGPSTSKCECLLPSTPIGGKCGLPKEYDECQLKPIMAAAPILMDEIIYRARVKFMEGFGKIVTECEGSRILKCKTETEYYINEAYCTCPDEKTGQDCNERLTQFLTFVRVPSLPTDGGSYMEKVKIFSELNTKALKFQKMFQLNGTYPCVWKLQMEAEMLVGSIKELGKVGTNRTKKQYGDLTKLIEDFTTAHKGQQICSEGYRCQFGLAKCAKQDDRDYVRDLNKFLEKSQTIECNQTGCSKFPSNEEADVEKNIKNRIQLSMANAKFCQGFKFCVIKVGNKVGTCYCGVPKDEDKLLPLLSTSTVSSSAVYNYPNQLTVTFLTSFFVFAVTTYFLF